MILTGPYHVNNDNNNVALPLSKSEQVRYIIAKRLAGSQDSLEHVINNQDAAAADKSGRYFFARLHNIHSIDNIDCAESGITLNIATFLSAILNAPTTLWGQRTLLNRNISPLTKTLENCHIKFSYPNEIPNRVPITIESQILDKQVNIDCARSTQALTGLLFATPLLPHDTHITASKLHDNAGYIDMTISILRHFEIIIERTTNIFFISGKQKYQNNPDEFYISSDATHSVNFAMLAALSGTIYFSNKTASLNIQSRSDLFIADFLQKVGAKAIIENGRLIQVSHGHLLSFEINAHDYPDTIPPIAALACHIEGTSHIYGINRLRYKESNRAVRLQQEFQKAGAEIELDWENDCMTIKGGVLNSCTIDSHGDHRIAMAAALLVANSNISIEIINPECVNKTFPDYFERIHKFNQ